MTHWHRNGNRYKRGSNQYLKKDKHNSIKYLYWYLSIVLLTVTAAYYFQSRGIEKAWSEAPIISPYLSPTPTTAPASEVTSYEEVNNEIKAVFGEHYEKAMKVLSCENSRLDPKATNTYGNSPEGSTDWGVFMINDHWQGITNPAFLTDYKINIRLAWNIYSRDGYSFKLWTCGRKFGI